MNCLECDHPLRPRRRTLDEYPGTRAVKAHGLCTSCSTMSYRRKAKDGPDERVSASFDLRQATSALEAYMMERRKRREQNGLAA